jgi:hypothetical protein
METTNNKLPDNIVSFFKELSEYLDTKILYFGSVQRGDYFPGKSDIDVDIFTDNEHSIITKMQHFMNIDKKKFKNFIWRLNHDNTMAHGHKVMYKNEEQNFNAEFSIYNEKYKQGILKEHLAKTILPFYATWMLIILKFFHYTIPLLEYKTFSYLKKKILTLGIGLPDDQFIVLDSK